MLDSVIIVIMAMIVIGKLSWNHGRKKGIEEGNIGIKNEGYREGKEEIRDEIRELAKESDEEILKRIKNFIKNNPK